MKDISVYAKFLDYIFKSYNGIQLVCEMYSDKELSSNIGYQVVEALIAMAED